jgi:hypothetical protein
MPGILELGVLAFPRACFGQKVNTMFRHGMVRNHVAGTLSIVPAKADEKVVALTGTTNLTNSKVAPRAHENGS